MARKILIMCLGLAVALAVAGTVALAVSTYGPVVTDPKDQVNPSISGNVVVWQDYRNKSIGCSTAQNCLGADIYTKDLTTGVEQLLTTTPDNTSADMDPDISGSKVVWRNWTTGKIVVHNLSDGSERSTSANTAQEVAPAISGDKVVWIDSRASVQYGDVYLRDLNAPAEEAVSLGSSLPAGTPDYKKDKRNPDIDGNIVVWEDWRNAYADAQGWIKNPDIYMKNLTTGVEGPVCTDLGDQYNPVVSGNRILWQDSRNGRWDVYMKDLGTGVETRLTQGTANVDHSWPSISGNLVAWKDQDRITKVEDIHTYDLGTGIESSLTADSYSQKMPVVSGASIAWIDKRAANWDIYVTDDTPPQISGAAPGGWITSQPLLTAGFSDVGTGINPASATVTLDSSPVAGCTASAAQIQCPVSGLADGSHTAVFNVSDRAGLPAAPATVSFSLDTTAPVISQVSPSGWQTSGSIVVTASYADSGSGIDTASAIVRVDGNPVAGCVAGASSVACPAVPLADGHHTASVDVNDQVGHAAIQGQTSFDIDTTSPSLGPLSITAPADSDTASFSAPFSDSGIGIDPASVVVVLDHIGIYPGTGQCTLGVSGISCTATGLAVGPHDIFIAVGDQLGFGAELSGSFSIVDTTPPLIINTAPTGTIPTPATTISADISDAVPSSGVNTGTVVVQLDSAAVAGCSVSASSVSCPLSGLSNGLHQVSVGVADNSGNPRTSNWSFSVDAPGPLISNMQPAPGTLVNYGWPAISADLASNGRGVDASSAHIYLDGTELSKSASATHISATLDSLTVERLSDGAHTARVTVADNQGVVSEQDWTFTVTSPSLHLFAGRIYWPSYDAYLQHLLSVDYHMSNPGLGACNMGEVTQGVATAGVLVVGPIPVDMGMIPGGGSFDYTMQYLVPPGISRFYATTYADCQDDGGTVFYFPGPVPFQ